MWHWAGIVSNLLIFLDWAGTALGSLDGNIENNKLEKNCAQNPHEITIFKVLCSKENFFSCSVLSHIPKNKTLIIDFKAKAAEFPY